MRRLSGITLAFALLLVGGLVAYMLHDSAQQDAGPSGVLQSTATDVAMPDSVQPEAIARDDVLALLADTAPVVGDPDGAQGAGMPESYRRALGALTGRVITADGDPVPDLPIEMLGGRRSLIIRSASAFLQPGGLDFDPVVGRTVTDAAGRFRLVDLQPRSIGVLVLDPAGPRALLWPLEISPVSGETRDLGDIVLPATATLRGKIADEHDQPVAGARVRATDIPGVDFVPDIAQFRAGGGVVIAEDDEQVAWVPPAAISALVSRLPVPTATTAADGTFELTGVPPGVVTLAVDEPEHLALMQGGVATGAAGGTRDLGTLLLGEGLPVSGRVLDGAGKPVASAEVLLGNPLGIAPGAVLRGPYRTADDGRFEAPGFRPGAVWAVARPDAQHEWTIATDLDTGRDNTLNLMLPRTLTLTVQDKDGAIVQNVEFYGRAVPEDEIPEILVSPHALSNVTRDEQARYVLGGLKPTVWQIVAKAPGRPQERVEVDLTNTDGTTTLQLQTGRALPVRVVDPTGAPIEWANLEAYQAEPSFEDPPVAVARTDEDGRAQLADLPATDVWVTATHPAWAIAYAKAELAPPADVPPGEAPAPEELVITLEVGGRLVGKVIDGAGPPAEPLLVIMVPTDDAVGDSFLPRMTVSDLQGAFSFDRIEGGSVHVEARSRENFTGGLQLFEALFDSALAEEEVTIATQGETSVLLDVGARYVGMETATLSGSLVVNGLPAEGWKVRCWGNIRRTVNVDARGRFDLGRVEAGKVELTFSAPSAKLMEGFADRREFEVAVGEHKVLDVVLSTGSIGGRVVSAITGRPLGSARVQVVTDGEDGWGRMMSAATEEDGQFLLEPVAAGRYRVTVRAEGHANYTSESFELGEMQAKDDLVLRVPAGLHVAGTLHFEGTSREPEWMWLVATAADGHTRDTSRIEGKDHAFSFDGLAPGEWTLTVATDLDEEFEEIKRTFDTDALGLSLTFVPKPPEPEPDAQAALEALGYVGSDKDDED